MDDKTKALEKQLQKSAETEKQNKKKELEELEKNPPETEVTQISAEITDENTDKSTDNTKKMLIIALLGVGAVGLLYAHNKTKAVA